MTIKEDVLFLGGTAFVALMITLSIIGGRQIYVHYVDKPTCEEFQQQNKDERVYFSNSSGCLIKRNGYWAKL